MLCGRKREKVSASGISVGVAVVVVSSTVLKPGSVRVEGASWRHLRRNASGPALLLLSELLLVSEVVEGVASAAEELEEKGEAVAYGMSGDETCAAAPDKTGRGEIRRGMRLKHRPAALAAVKEDEAIARSIVNLKTPPDLYFSYY